MSIGYSNIAKSYLMVAVDNDDTQLILNNYEGFSRIDADYTYAVMVNATGDKEIVKIDLSNSGVHTRLIASGVTSYSGGLTVARGQGSSTAAAWPRGTLIYIDVTADFLGEIMQKGQFRSVAYNPNGVLSPAYFGEKIYQSDNSRWWKSYNATDPYWAMTTGSAADGEYWDDSGLGWDVLMPSLWAAYLDNTYWVKYSYGTWDGVKWDAEFRGPFYAVTLNPTGTWATDFRPTKMRIAHDCSAPLMVSLVAGGSYAYNSGTYSYTSGLEVDISCVGDITYLGTLSEGATDFNITNIEFLE